MYDVYNRKRSDIKFSISLPLSPFFYFLIRIISFWICSLVIHSHSSLKKITIHGNIYFYLSLRSDFSRIKCDGSSNKIEKRKIDHKQQPVYWLISRFLWHMRLTMHQTTENIGIWWCFLDLFLYHYGISTIIKDIRRWFVNFCLIIINIIISFLVS